ncbi:uncharacterized protein Gasu_15530 [Galdieria sulphuraria]|uniref:Mob1/phocein family protein n=1 Tax=Galdieria sulphuraria TaxID=130081 RepID=M2Y639_GALSU|nr:uncharacterized protein Gasu_15530 [Galdieria sulphuraria]EME31319.1 hypothetical protein Gasu_15530 [Galdieria sulphuraria]|eukprot:XP_005707839.1 hypothetical protein Gasu_15530 [Galdieria sulphuraria]
MNNNDKLCYPGSSVVDFDRSLPLSTTFSKTLELQTAVQNYKGIELEDYVREQVLRFVIQLNVLACYLGEVCSYSSCPQMTATKDVLYLCAAHEVAQECCAIDYISHCLDGATSLLTSEDVISHNNSGKVQEVNLQPFRVIMRRLYRLFAHAYFHHIDTFQRFEQQTELFHHFCSFATAFNLISPSDMLVPVDFASVKGSLLEGGQI